MKEAEKCILLPFEKFQKINISQIPEPTSSLDKDLLITMKKQDLSEMEKISEYKSI